MLWVVSVVFVAALIAVVTHSISWLPRAVLYIYFPPSFVAGTPDARLTLVAIFLVATAFLLYRRKYWAALAALVLPMSVTWIIAWQLMGD